MSTMATRRFPLVAGVTGRAVFSDDLRYRYWLERRWDPELPRFAFVLLNPSAAGAHHDDPTTRKLYELTRANGGGSYELVNLFPLIDTAQSGLGDPTAIGDPSSVNDAWIRQVAGGAAKVVVGWGDARPDDATHRGRRAAVGDRAGAVWRLVRDRQPWCVGHNVAMTPRHPGQGVRNDTALIRYVPPSGR